MLTAVQKICLKRRHQEGAVAVEFALVAIIFVNLMLGIVDFARWTFAIGSAAEATRMGARIAVVCDVNTGASNPARAWINGYLPGAVLGNVVISYSGTASPCTISTCETVTVSLNGYGIPRLAWWLPAMLNVPNFSTTLTRESLQSTAGGSTSASC